MRCYEWVEVYAGLIGDREGMIMAITARHTECKELPDTPTPMYTH